VFQHHECDQCQPRGRLGGVEAHSHVAYLDRVLMLVCAFSRQGPFNAKALLDLYNTDPSVKHLKPYTPIIYESEVT